MYQDSYPQIRSIILLYPITLWKILRNCYRILCTSF